MENTPGASMSRFPFVALAVLVLVVGLSAAQPRPREHGRLFPPEDLGLLEAPDRDQWQRPDQIMDALGIADASVVADIGAGSGWFTVRLARRVGPNGVVYAQDVQKEMLTATARRAQREGLLNVRTVLGTDTDPLLPPGQLDAVLIVDVVREMQDRTTFFRNLARSVKPQGRIGVVDYRLDGAGPGPELEQRVSADIVRADAEAAGLRLLRSESFLPYQYFLIFAPGVTNDQTAGSTAAATSSLARSASTKG
jgi:SAM-dependent methyltransferase